MSQRRPTDSELTAYASELVNYGVQTRAWRKAFPRSTVDEKRACGNASTFHKLPSVRRACAEMERRASLALEREFDISASDIRKRLVDAADSGAERRTDAQGNIVPINIAGSVSALSEINRMNGNHAATKTEHSGTVAVTELTDNQLNSRIARLLAGDD